MSNQIHPALAISSLILGLCSFFGAIAFIESEPTPYVRAETPEETFPVRADDPPVTIIELEEMRIVEPLVVTLQEVQVVGDVPNVPSKGGAARRMPTAMKKQNGRMIHVPSVRANMDVISKPTLAPQEKTTFELDGN